MNHALLGESSKLLLVTYVCYANLRSGLASLFTLLPVLSCVAYTQLLFVDSQTFLTYTSCIRAPTAVPAPHTFSSSFERTSKYKLWVIRKWGGEAKYNPY